MDNVETFEAKLHNCEERLKDIANEIETLREHFSEEYFKFDVHEYRIRPEQGYAPIKIAGTWHTLPEAEEFHRQFGRLLANLKKKYSHKGEVDETYEQAQADRS